MIVTYPDPGKYQGRQEQDDKIRAAVAKQLGVEPDSKQARQSQSMIRTEGDEDSDEYRIVRSLKFDNFIPTLETQDSLTAQGFVVYVI